MPAAVSSSTPELQRILPVPVSSHAPSLWTQIEATAVSAAAAFVQVAVNISNATALFFNEILPAAWVRFTHWANDNQTSIVVGSICAVTGALIVAIAWIIHSYSSPSSEPTAVKLAAAVKQLNDADAEISRAKQAKNLLPTYQQTINDCTFELQKAKDEHRKDEIDKLEKELAAAKARMAAADQLASRIPEMEQAAEYLFDEVTRLKIARAQEDAKVEVPALNAAEQAELENIENDFLRVDNNIRNFDYGHENFLAQTEAGAKFNKADMEWRACDTDRVLALLKVRRIQRELDTRSNQEGFDKPSKEAELSQAKSGLAAIEKQADDLKQQCNSAQKEVDQARSVVFARKTALEREREVLFDRMNKLRETLKLAPYENQDACLAKLKKNKDVVWA